MSSNSKLKQFFWCMYDLIKKNFNFLTRQGTIGLKFSFPFSSNTDLYSIKSNMKVKVAWESNKNCTIFVWLLSAAKYKAEF